jgi:hypothetical protein
MAYGQWPGQDGQQRHEQGNGQQGYAPGQYQPRPPRGKSWPARHKVLTGVFGVAALIIVIVAVANAGGSPSSPGSGTAVGLTTSASATATTVPSQPATRAAAAVQKTHPQRVQTTSAPPKAAAPPAPAPTTTAAAPTRPAAVVAPPASAAPASCRPLTSGGNCYEPGEYCRNADHGASGVAGDGKAITCEDNDGWRWEPA